MENLTFQAILDDVARQQLYFTAGGRLMSILQIPRG
jgi:hypothetical protein